MIAPRFVREMVQRDIDDRKNVDVLAKNGHRAMSPVVGTESYRSPELIIGNGEYDPKAADIWSLGCVLIEILHCINMPANHDDVNLSK